MPSWAFNLLVALVAITLTTTGIVVLAWLALPAWASALGALLLVVSLVAAAIGASSLLDWIRRRTVARVARRLGMSFQPDASREILERFGSPPLLRRRGIARNLMRGTFEGRSVAVLDFEYTRGSGRWQQSVRQTVAVVMGRSTRGSGTGRSPFAVERGDDCALVYREGRIASASSIPALLREAVRLAGD